MNYLFSTCCDAQLVMDDGNGYGKCDDCGENATTHYTSLLERLRAAVEASDKNAILAAYDAIEEDETDWAELPAHIGDEYDFLVDQANETLYS